MVGGCTKNQRHLADLLSFDPMTGEWKTLPSMAVARSQMGVAVINDHLFVVGGDNKHKVLDSVERYSFKKVSFFYLFVVINEDLFLFVPE